MMTAQRAVVPVVLALALLGVVTVALFVAARRFGPRGPAVGQPVIPVAAQSPALDRLPVLHQGRIKPLVVAADEMVMSLTGRGSFGRKEDGTAVRAVDLVIDLLLAPEAWRERPLLSVPRLELRERLGLAGEWATPVQAESPAAFGLIGQAARKRARAESGEVVPMSALDGAALELAARAGEARDAMAGRAFALAPLAATPQQRAWAESLREQLAAEPAAGESPWRERLRAAFAARARGERSAASEAKAAAPIVVGTGEDPLGDIWLTVDELALHPDPLLDGWPDGHGVRPAAVAWVAALRGNDVGGGGDAGPATVRLAEAARAAGAEHLALRRAAGDDHFAPYPSDRLIGVELSYRRLRPFTWAWVLFILGGTLTGVGMARSTAVRRHRLVRIGEIATVLGTLLVAVGLTARVLITSWGAVTNMYETLIFVALIVAVLGLVLTRITGNAQYAVAAGIGAGLCAMVGEALPPDLGQNLSQLKAVLRSKFWLWIHVKTIVASYAAFVLAWVLGNLVLARAALERRAVTTDESRAIYRALQVGIVLVAAGTLLGGFWAKVSWGRFWGWDPKEIGALIILLTYLIPLHLRHIGAVGPTGLTLWSVLGFFSVVMSWWGVNFLLGTGLHAYATGNGFGEASWDMVVIGALSLIQLVVVAVEWQALRSVRRAAPAAPPSPGDPGA